MGMTIGAAGPERAATIPAIVPNIERPTVLGKSQDVNVEYC
jgi:hypothetical protein